MDAWISRYCPQTLTLIHQLRALLKDKIKRTYGVSMACSWRNDGLCVDLLSK